MAQQGYQIRFRNVGYVGYRRNEEGGAGAGDQLRAILARVVQRNRTNRLCVCGSQAVSRLETQEELMLHLKSKVSLEVEFFLPKRPQSFFS